MTDILRLFFIIILLTIALAAYFLVIGALFTNRAAKTQRVMTAIPGRSFGVGLVNFAFFGVIALVLFSGAGSAGGFIRFILTVPALLITAILAIMLSFGLAGMSNILGERIFPDQPAWKQIAWGTVICGLRRHRRIYSGVVPTRKQLTCKVVRPPSSLRTRRSCF
jgi:hypothetical protein